MKHPMSCMIVSVLILLSQAHADDAANPGAMGRALAEQILARPANEGRVGEMHFSLVNARGARRERKALMAHSDTGELVRIAIFFTAPGAIRETAFLSHDAPGDDDQNWLYLPATERVRRLPVSERGDYFMGTDLTYGDIRDDFKFPLEDWDFEHGGESGEGIVLRGTARSADVVRETGYGGFEAIVDPQTLFPVIVRYADGDGAPLKEVRIEEQQQIGGAWTAMRFVVENLQRQHRTEIVFENMRHVPALGDAVFNPASLSLGVPRIP